jgi:hypothetical protein
MDMTVECFTPEYNRNLIFVFVMIVCFVFGFPVFIACSLYTFKNSIKVRVLDGQGDSTDIAISLREHGGFFEMFHYAASRKERAAAGMVFVKASRVEKDAHGRNQIRPLKKSLFSIFEASARPILVEPIMRKSTNDGGGSAEMVRIPSRHRIFVRFHHISGSTRSFPPVLSDDDAISRHRRDYTLFSSPRLAFFFRLRQGDLVFIPSTLGIISISLRAARGHCRRRRRRRCRCPIHHFRDLRLVLHEQVLEQWARANGAP